MKTKLFLTCFFLSTFLNLLLIFFPNFNKTKPLTDYSILTSRNFKDYQRINIKLKTISGENKNNPTEIFEEKNKKTEKIVNELKNKINSTPKDFFSSQNTFDDNNSITNIFNGHLAVTNSKNQKLDEDEYYSFYMRIMENYLIQLNLNLFDFVQSGQLKNNEEMLARVIFDKLGHAQSLKILKWAKDDTAQEKFLTALQNIKKIQNPPKKLISDDETFTVYYGLKIKI